LNPKKTITLTAPAKINLFLEVLGKRPDGYHELETVMQAVDLVDTLTLEVFYKFHKDKLETDKCRQIVGLAVGEVFGTDPARLILQLGQRLQPAKEEVVADSVDEDLVAAAAEIFKVEAV